MSAVLKFFFSILSLLSAIVFEFSLYLCHCVSIASLDFITMKKFV